MYLQVVVVERLQLLCPSAAGIFKKEEKESGVNEMHSSHSAFPKMQIREKSKESFCAKGKDPAERG